MPHTSPIQLPCFTVKNLRTRRFSKVTRQVHSQARVRTKPLSSRYPWVWVWLLVPFARARTQELTLSALGLVLNVVLFLSRLLPSYPQRGRRHTNLPRCLQGQHQRYARPLLPKIPQALVNLWLLWVVKDLSHTEPTHDPWNVRVIRCVLVYASGTLGKHRLCMWTNWHSGLWEH